MAQILKAKGTSADTEGIFFSVPGVVVVTWDPACKAVCGKWQSWASSTEFAAALEAAFFETVAEAKEWLNRPFIKTPTSLEAQLV